MSARWSEIPLARPAIIALVVACAVPAAVPAGAQDAAPPVEMYESDIYGWVAPSPDEQLAADTTVIPRGRGAFFVPYLSDPVDEPDFVVYQGDERVRSASPGARVVVPPGAYRVEMGSGRAHEVALHVKVLPDETTLVPVTWGGLQVEVVDDRNIPHRAGYELIRVADRDIFGVGYGADLLAGERLQTWILRPDLYRIVQPGASYRTRQNYATVYVPAGGFVRYRLVVDPETGEFLGAGVVTPEESGGVTGDERITPNLVLGLSGNLNIDRDIVTTVEAYVDGGVTFRDEPHTFLALLQFEEGMSWRDPEVGAPLPVQKGDDRLRVDLLYSYDLTRVFAPYARAGVEAELFPTTIVPNEDVTVIYNDADGTQRVLDIDANEAYQTADFGGKTLIFEGLGINATVWRHERGQLRIGTGVGLRQSLHNGLYSEITRNGDVDPPQLVYEEVEEFFQEGFEGLATGRVRIGDVASFTTNFEIFSDFGAIDDPVYFWENTLGVRLVEVLSLDYVLEVEREPSRFDEVQVRHEILLRLAWEVL